MSTFKEDMGSDLSKVFFNSEEFAEVVVYRPAGVALNGYKVSAIVDMTPETPQPQGNGYATVHTNYIHIQVKEADVVDGPLIGDTVVVRGVEYGITEPPSDGVGVLTLILHKK